MLEVKKTLQISYPAFILLSPYYTIAGFEASFLDFSGGTVDRNPPASAGDMGLMPGPGNFHTPWSNYAPAPQLLTCTRGLASCSY